MELRKVRCAPEATAVVPALVLLLVLDKPIVFPSSATSGAFELLRVDRQGLESVMARPLWASQGPATGRGSPRDSAGDSSDVPCVETLSLAFWNLLVR